VNVTARRWYPVLLLLRDTGGRFARLRAAVFRVEAVQLVLF
jgi:hypothetical protein